jgi:hypothetical protein
MKISLKVSGLDGLKNLAAQIKRYPAQAAEAGTQAANDVAGTVVTRASQDLTQRYNLSTSYIRSKFQLRLARRFDEAAVVAARKSGLPLARYAAQQITVAAPRAKGDASRGIAAGRKQAGVSFKVRRSGARHTIRRAFLMPLKAGSSQGGNGLGIFWRDDGGFEQSMVEEEITWDGKKGVQKGKARHLYGVSPHQGYRYWIKQNSPAVPDLLAKAFAARLAQQLRKGGK